MAVTGQRTSNKEFKQQEHQRERCLVNTTLKSEREPVINHKKFGNEWASPRDGKMWFGNCKYRIPGDRIDWPSEYKKWMRK